MNKNKIMEKKSFNNGFLAGGLCAAALMFIFVVLSGGNININYNDKRKYIVEEDDGWDW